MDEKTLFDGRLHFHKEASDIRSNIYKCVFLKDYEGWANCLTMFFSMTSPYMNTDNRNRIRDSLNSVSRQIMIMNNSRNTNISTYNVTKQLNSIFEDIMMCTKKMWLPIEELNDEWSTELFLSGTG